MNSIVRWRKTCARVVFLSFLSKVNARTRKMSSWNFFQKDLTRIFISLIEKTKVETVSCFFFKINSARWKLTRNDIWLVDALNHRWFVLEIAVRRWKSFFSSYQKFVEKNDSMKIIFHLIDHIDRWIIERFNSDEVWCDRSRSTDFISMILFFF